MSSILPEPNAASQRFLRKHPAWFGGVRSLAFIVISFILLAAYAIFLLPPKVAPSLQANLSLGVFIILALTWSSNILSDKDKPELLKGVVAFCLIGVLGWLFYRFSGAHWDKLQSSFFDLNLLQGNWDYLLSGLLVNLELEELVDKSGVSAAYLFSLGGGVKPLILMRAYLIHAVLQKILIQVRLPERWVVLSCVMA